MANKKTLLLVEDDPLLAMLEKIQLENQGYRMIPVSSGEEAGSAALREPKSTSSSWIFEVFFTQKENRLELTVKDNGKGLPENFLPGNSRGFGMVLIQMLASQFQGNFEMRNQDGTRSEGVLQLNPSDYSSR